MLLTDGHHGVLGLSQASTNKKACLGDLVASTVQRDCISRHLVIVFVVYYLGLLEKLKLNR